MRPNSNDEGGPVTLSGDEIRRLNGQAHFHYSEVNIENVKIKADEGYLPVVRDLTSIGSYCFKVMISHEDEVWYVMRNLDDFTELDTAIHKCAFERSFSCLKDLSKLYALITNPSNDMMHMIQEGYYKNQETSTEPAARGEELNGKPGIDEIDPGQSSNARLTSYSTYSAPSGGSCPQLYMDIQSDLAYYIVRFTELLNKNIVCSVILNWFHLGNRGRRFVMTDEIHMNVPAIAVARCVKRYVAQAKDELNLEVGEIVSITVITEPNESHWWRGKQSLEVGYFPSECVQLIGDCKSLMDVLDKTKSGRGPELKPLSIAANHGKAVTIMKSFLTTRPSATQLRQRGILQNRIFGCDLGEHLMRTGERVPCLVSVCCQFIEKYGAVDGIYRIPGAANHLNDLRSRLDCSQDPTVNDLVNNKDVMGDVHCVSGVLKLYFRDLPNPLLTFGLYEKFISAVSQIGSKHSEDLVAALYDTVQQLPPPHYQTLKELLTHLSRMTALSADTKMDAKNLNIVWAPNLIRAPCEAGSSTGGDMAAAMELMKNLNSQGLVVEYLIFYANELFADRLSEATQRAKLRPMTAYNKQSLMSLDDAKMKFGMSVVPEDSLPLVANSTHF